MSIFTAYESVPVSSTALGLTAATYENARGAIITVEDAAVRYRLDGTAPTSTEGHVQLAGGVIRLSSADEIKNFRVIRKDSVNATLRVSYSNDASFVSSDNFSALVSGDMAAGAIDSGNPVKVGGKYNATQPTLTDGQRGDLQLNAFGSLRAIVFFSGTGADSLSNSSQISYFANQGTTLGQAGLGVVGSHIFNGTSWDRQRNNVAATGLASGARTASTPTPDQTNYNGRGAHIFLDITATPNNTETLQVTIEEKDPVSNKYIQIAAFPALTASTLGATPTAETYLYEIGPGISETIAVAKHELQALLLSRTWRVNVLHSAAGSWTYSVGIVNLV